MTSPVDNSVITRFREDGVVHLPGAFDAHWIEMLRAGISKNLSNPSPRFESRIPSDGSPELAARYMEDFWVWSIFPEFENFVRQSPAAELAAALLDATRINLVMDNWFMREAGARSRAPWHHDIAYFDFAGSMCVLWVPLEPIKSTQGIELIRGSHLWDKLFMRVFFKDHNAAQPAGWVNGLYYELPPDIDNHRGDYDIVSFDMDLGDCLMFDMRTLHGSPAGVVQETTSRRFSLRMAAEDSRIVHRGEWAAQERAMFEAAGHREGDTLNSNFFPQLWPR